MICDLVPKIRDQISSLWHDRVGEALRTSNQSFATLDQYQAFCASKDWLQDTSEAINFHYSNGFSTSPLGAYLEFWGVLQACIVQQDAINEMNYALTGNPKLFIKDNSMPDNWAKLRRLRNLAVGHPNRQQTRGEPLRRSVTGRELKSYSSIKLAVYTNEKSEFDDINLEALIRNYDREAAAILSPCVKLLEDQLDRIVQP